MHATPVFIPAPMNVSLQHGMPYQAVEPSDTASQARYASVSAQQAIVDPANADAPATLHIRKHPQKSFTDDARLLESMVEDSAPEFRGARRNTRAHIPSGDYSQPHPSSRRGSRDSFSAHELPVLPMPEAAAVDALPPPSPPSQPTYFGYAVRDPNEGKIANFEPADDAFKTTRGREEVMQALRSNDEPEQPLQAPVPQRPLPAIPEQPPGTEQPSREAAAQEAGHFGLPDACIQSMQLQHRYGIPPPRDVSDIPVSDTSYHGLEKDFTKLWVASGADFDDGTLFTLFRGQPGLVHIGRVIRKPLNKYCKYPSRVPGPTDNFAFVQ